MKDLIEDYGEIKIDHDDKVIGVKDFMKEVKLARRDWSEIGSRTRHSNTSEIGDVLRGRVRILLSCTIGCWLKVHLHKLHRR